MSTHDHSELNTMTRQTEIVLMANAIRTILGHSFALVWQHNDECPADLITDITDHDKVSELLTAGIARIDSDRVDPESHVVTVVDSRG